MPTPYEIAMAAFEADSANPPRILRPLPGVPIAQSKPAPLNTPGAVLYQPPETGNIDGIITQDDARADS